MAFGILFIVFFFSFSLLLIRLQLHTETKRSILNHSFLRIFFSSDFLILDRLMCECVCLRVCYTEIKLEANRRLHGKTNQNTQRSINDWSKRINLLLFFLCGVENDLRRRNVVLDLISFTFFAGFIFCKTISSCVWDFFYAILSIPKKESILRYFSTEKKYIRSS